MNSTYSNQSRCQISAHSDDFNFSDQICSKTVFPLENRKSEHHHCVLHIQIAEARNFSWNNFDSFGPNLLEKGIYGWKWTKWILPLNSAYSNWPYVPNFSLSWQLIFWNKFARKGYFGLKTEKVNTATKLCIFELVYKPNFTLNNFEFWGQICPKRAFPVENGKSEHHHWNLPFRFSLGVTF